MKILRNWNDLKAYGFDLLTGEACKLSLRGLFDITASGRDILRGFLSALDMKMTLQLPSEWNGCKAGGEKTVNSVMLPYELFRPLAAYILLTRGGCRTVYYANDGSVVGVDKGEAAETEEQYESLPENQKLYEGDYEDFKGKSYLNIRKITVYQAPGTVDRCQHQFSERTI